MREYRYYTEEEKNNVIKMIRRGFSLSAIVKATGMSKPTVTRIKRKAIEEEPNLKDRSLKVELTLGYIEKTLGQLINSERLDLAKELAEYILNSENSSKDVKDIMKVFKMKVDIKMENFNDAEDIFNSMISDEDLLPGTKAKLCTQFITMNIKKGEYDEAEKMAREMLNDENVTLRTKIILGSQLITIKKEKGEYDESKKIAEEMLKNENLSLRDKVVIGSQLIGINIELGEHDIREYDIAEYRAENIINNDELPFEDKIVIYSQLITVKRRNGKLDEARRIEKEILEHRKIKNIYKDEIYSQLLLEILTEESSYKENVEKAEGESLKQTDINEEPILREEEREEEREETSEETKKPKKIKYDIDGEDDELRTKRNSLYEGKIDLDDMKQITEENKDTLKGCLFIAETCRYFDLANLGTQCLKGYRKSNENISKIELRAIANALEILKRDFVNVQRLKEEWNKVYECLEQSRDGEEHE